jgi:hypothetical protein
VRCPYCGKEVEMELKMVPRLVPEDPHDPLLPEDEFATHYSPPDIRRALTAAERARAYRERKKLEGK